ncbi:hypothetical protein CKO12_13185 [Chromatium okenii]|uniref:molybdopterin-dependent oxidoreductase n=1 Tax=Chromatium okenii TaxID=61644 RepID=UPI0019076CDB|nr:molybdopterin-dependent oxidoreductase [Chromatium okenii]MBK1642806.1 hypothetical protein [Chromatium okenii]
MSRLNDSLFAVALLSASCAIAAPDHAPAPLSYASDAVAITGAVEHPRTLTIADLEQLPPQNISEVTMICDSGVNLGKKANLRGVLLRDILNQAQLKAVTPRDFRKMAIIAKATDNYQVVFSWGELFNSAVGDQIIVYFRQDGQPLGVEEGQIALISTTDLRTGPRHVRWLNAIEVRQIVQ